MEDGVGARYRISCSEPASYLLGWFEASFSHESEARLSGLGEGDNLNVTGLLTVDFEDAFYLSRCYIAGSEEDTLLPR